MEQFRSISQEFLIYKNEKRKCKQRLEMSETIKIFARIRPPRSNVKFQQNSSGKYVIQDSEAEIEAGESQETTTGNKRQRLTLFPGKNDDGGLINNTKERFDFAFHRIFDESIKQDEVFNQMAKEVVDGALDGYNGTIFAYGQTGSGKTFTITGGTERYSDRGIIPRTLQYIFREASKVVPLFFAPVSNTKISIITTIEKELVICNTDLISGNLQ
jgi:kinesin family protein 6/9